MSLTFSRVVGAALAVTVTFASAHAGAQGWPSKPVRLVVPYAAGGSTDTLARIVGAQLGERLGQQIVIERDFAAVTNVAGSSNLLAVGSGRYRLRSEQLEWYRPRGKPRAA